MRLLLRFPFLVLQIVAGLLTAYGTFGMISTAGIQPPNPVVLLGLIAVVASGLAAARVGGNPFAGWWPSLAADRGPVAARHSSPTRSDAVSTRSPAADADLQLRSSRGADLLRRERARNRPRDLGSVA